jgi:D-alanyl-D-alanine carboxypeptidase/D-alanyl-D-alanine-endopeptidase (penicillin-binding protein 4)
MARPRTATVVGVVCVLLLALAAASGAYFGGLSLRPHQHDRAVAEPSALLAAPVAPAPVAPSTTGSPAVAAPALAAALAPGLADARLGRQVLAQVVDAATGTVLFDRSSTVAAAPASTAKLATAAAVLSVHAPTDRIRTTVVAGAPGTAVLIGAGDPTLSAAPAGSPTLYRDAARISDLAGQLRSSAITRIVVDGSLFTGPSVAPSWLSEDVPSDYAGAITAVMADGARDTPDSVNRSATPDLAAGRELAADLGLPATAVTAGAAPAGAAVLAQVDSASYGELVRQMLQDSDNVLAEVLARQVAVSLKQPASFTGAAAAIRAVLAGAGAGAGAAAGAGVDIGSGMTDASGLAPADRLTPAALTGVLRLLDDPAHPVLGQVAADLPVAGWSGTLADRFRSGASRAGAGYVRAKTGTLTGVSTLAGLVTTPSGRLLAFSFVADQVGASVADTDAAESALDELAAAIAACTCA